jgi:RNA ligase
MSLYDDLMKLCINSEQSGDDCFFFKDHTLDDKMYRIFNYRLASYSQWLEKGALECRGIMYEVSGAESTLVSRPMEKFFNLNENPLSMELDLDTIEEVFEKADGSLISTYLHNNTLKLKSKGSLSSDQAVAAMEWLNHPCRAELQQTIEFAALNGFTCNLEWCSPDNRIVIGYEESQLKLLNVRHNSSGEYDQYNYQMICDMFHIGVETKPLDVYVPKIKDGTVRDEVGVEGYVMVLTNGQRIKVKNDWYISLHHTKDSVNSPKRLFHAVLEDGSDDLRSMLSFDPLAIKMIDEMETYVFSNYNKMIRVAESFHSDNISFDRKQYAIKAKEDLETHVFGLAMQLYTGNEPDYKKSFAKAMCPKGS